jgi:hypothetical protein
MDEKEFNRQKAKLLNSINSKLSDQATGRQDVYELEHVLKIVEGYHFRNRLSMKGVLTHTIIDSIQLDSEFLVPFIYFDKSIK